MKEPIGFGSHKLPIPPGASPEERTRRVRHMLCRVLNMHTTVLFVGAGCSAALGYPTWRELASRVVEATLGVLDGGTHRDDIERVRRFYGRLESGEQLPSEKLLFILGACQRILEWRHAGGIYREALRGLFQPRDLPPGTPNPYRALLELPVRRFVTSNYDHELERALVQKHSRKGKIPPSEFELDDSLPDVRRRVFTQLPRYRNQLAVFALGKVQEAENTVFHCHGSYRDPHSLVVTEADYQRWYLAGEGEGAREFRQTIRLLFGSNPILFVGFGLGDEDLLRPLRRFVAVDPDRKASRPIFALLPEAAAGADRDDHEHLYERYGVHVLPYVSPEGNDAVARGRALCAAIDTLKDAWNQWRQGWLEKPAVRRIEIKARPPRTYRHYSLTPGRQDVLGEARVRQRLDDWQHAIEGGVKVFALVGPGGTGKSWHAMKLLERLERHSEVFDGFFFWSSYYADDSLTGLDRALRYLDPENQKTGSRYDRLLACLEERRYFLIFDGIERLLRETRNPDEGEAYHWTTAKFLAVISDPRSHSTVLLTSRLWPEAFGSPHPREEWIRSVHLPRLQTEDLEGVKPFSWLPRGEVSALCSLLDGHSYGIRLAAQILRLKGRREVKPCSQRLRRALADTPPHFRVSRIISRAINTVDNRWSGLAAKFLERVAVFMSPVTEKTIDICYELAKASHSGESPDGAERDGLVSELLDMRLLYQVTVGQGEAEPCAYTVHPTVRGYVFQRFHEAESEALPNFTLPGFTAGTAAVDPGSPQSVKMVTELFGSLCDHAEGAHRAGDRQEARRLCRSAFGVVRSRMSSITTPRWGSYDDFLRLVIRLVNLAKEVSPRLWDYVERQDLRTVEGRDGTLHADELAWLYNEIGLTCFGEGTMLDTIAVWEQGYEINRVIDSVETGGPFTVQSLLNMGAAYLEYGRLNQAEGYLRKAERANYRLHDVDLRGRITGYLALVQHLRGDLARAGTLYKEALGIFSKVPNPRAESVFLRHQGDLLIKLGDLPGARLSIESSRALAEAARYPDLVAYARSSEGHLLRAEEEYRAALREYQAALHTARQKGIRKLQADVLSELSRLALDLGDARLAQERAIEALQLANELTLGLRQTHGLVVLGVATLEAGQQALGIAYLEHARSLADRQEYWLRGREAEKHLHRYGAVSSPASQG